MTKELKRKAREADLVPVGMERERKEKLKKLQKEAALAKSGEVAGQLSTAQNVRESKFLDVQGSQALLWLPDKISLETVGHLRGLGFRNISFGMKQLRNIATAVGRIKVWFIMGEFAAALQLSLDVIKADQAEDVTYIYTYIYICKFKLFGLV
jgi:hypothetical protein